ncbi:helix-turn-helix transcriptional regulator [Rathayibacter tanaceti]|uniref:Helix-turn-helix transcriptional regulator n=2 Tax=Rathayibacter tanaceti TaxID=1671680 RepID=A0AAE6V564_9MICO|nr:LuxR C-terminal-related transcriptional regulator [Rathayibacter tanaceti]QHC54528.1 helix-turn-helix transcriptional regulator [Rathayibacter tanaceti]
MDLMSSVEVLRAPLTETQARLSALLADAVPHSVIAQLAANCPFAPFKSLGASPGAPGSSISVADMTGIGERAGSPGAWLGRAVVANVEVPVLALVSGTGEQRALLVLIRTDEEPIDPDDIRAAVGLWEVVTAHRDGLRNEAAPEWLAISRAAASARAVALAELGDAHSVLLTALVAVLRDRTLADAEARRRTLDVAVSGLVELRSRLELDRILAEESAAEASSSLTASLLRMTGPRGVRLDVSPLRDDDASGRSLPADVAATARASVRTIVQTMLEEQSGLRRIHVGWRLTDADLVATVRDDGPGALAREAFDSSRVQERLTAVGARLDVDAVPDWGTTVVVSVPITAQPTPRTDPLAALSQRELDVAQHLLRGSRNRDIARALTVSESTVKFHLASIFKKLDVDSRSRAAAVVAAAQLP